MIVGITRIRNESAIIAETLRLSAAICDALLVYDDCSSDDTPALVEQHAQVPVRLIRGDRWEPDRPAEETRHRRLLAEEALRRGADWIFCFDADERFDAGVRDLLLSKEASGYHGVRVRFFDAYMTPDSRRDHVPGEPLASLPRRFGPEYRDILVAWRPSPLFVYEGLDLREPVIRRGARILLSGLRCRHYGKAISAAHWEETCDYYARHFPEPYRSKWTARRGKAVHVLSDFGAPLYDWDEVAAHAVPMPKGPPRRRRGLLGRLKQRLREYA